MFGLLAPLPYARRSSQSLEVRETSERKNLPGINPEGFLRSNHFAYESRMGCLCDKRWWLGGYALTIAE
jgi:hypothetical protein